MLPAMMPSAGPGPQLDAVRFPDSPLEQRLWRLLGDDAEVFQAQLRYREAELNAKLQLERLRAGMADLRLRLGAANAPLAAAAEGALSRGAAPVAAPGKAPAPSPPEPADAVSARPLPALAGSPSFPAASWATRMASGSAPTISALVAVAADAGAASPCVQQDGLPGQQLRVPSPRGEMAHMQQVVSVPSLPCAVATSPPSSARTPAAAAVTGVTRTASAKPVASAGGVTIVRPRPSLPEASVMAPASVRSVPSAPCLPPASGGGHFGVQPPQQLSAPASSPRPDGAAPLQHRNGADSACAGAPQVAVATMPRHGAVSVPPACSGGIGRCGSWGGCATQLGARALPAASLSRASTSSTLGIAGFWRCVYKAGVALRARPDVEAERTGVVIACGEVFRVVEGVSGPEGLYLRVEQNRGWAFERRSGYGQVCVPAGAVSSSPMVASARAPELGGQEVPVTPAPAARHL